MEEENADEEKSDSVTDSGHMEKEESREIAKKVEFMTLKVRKALQLFCLVAGIFCWSVF